MKQLKCLLYGVVLASFNAFAINTTTIDALPSSGALTGTVNVPVSVDGVTKRAPLADLRGQKLITVASASYTTTVGAETDTTFLVDATSNHVQITLQSANSFGAGKTSRITFKRVDTSGYKVVIRAASGESIEDAPFRYMCWRDTLSIQSFGGNNWSINNDRPSPKYVFDNVSSSYDTTYQYAISQSFTALNGARYAVRNNAFGFGSAGVGEQHNFACSERDWGFTSSHKNGPDSMGWVKSYGSVFRGWVRYEGLIAQTDAIGIQVGALTKARLRWKFDAPNNAGTVGIGAFHRVNALWDIYLGTNPSPPGAYIPNVSLMINQYDIDADLFYGPHSRDSATLVTLGGKSWRMWIHTAEWATDTVIELFPPDFDGPANDWIVFGTKDLDFNLKGVLDDLVTLGHFPASHYLLSIQAGFEDIAYGDYRTRIFCVALQSESETDCD
jgi:hypothetical protein